MDKNHGSVEKHICHPIFLLFQMSVEGSSKTTITCFLCGGVHVHPGPKFGNHLLHEHGIVFNREYIAKVSQYKDKHASLPAVSGNHKHTVSGLEKYSQTEDAHVNCSQHSKPAVDQFITSTPVRKHQFPSQPMNLSSPGAFFSTPAHQSLQLGHSIQQELSVQESPSIATDSELPERSGFTCKCALCPKGYHDDAAFWGHITKKHGLDFKKYKEQHGSCQSSNGTGEFQCLLCKETVKHLPGCVDKHLKFKHRLTWSQYLDWFKERMAGARHEIYVTRSKSPGGAKAFPEERYLPTPGDPSTSMKKSKLMNIRDKNNKHCSYCEVTFDTRMIFLKHCQDSHNMRFKNKHGAPVVLSKTANSGDELHEQVVEKKTMSVVRRPTPQDDQQVLSITITPNDDRLPVPGVSRTTTPGDHISSTLQPTSSPPDSSSKRKWSGEGGAPCYYCGKMYSSYGNMERHARLSCTMREDRVRDMGKVQQEQALAVTDNSVVVVEGCAGFKCGKCGRVFSKIGNLNRHNLYTCPTQ